MAMAARRSLSQSLARTTTTTTTLRRRPPPRSLHHHHQDNKLMMSSWSTTSRNTSGSGGNSCKGCQDRDRLIDELEQERRRFVRMTTDNKLSGTTSPEGPTGRRWGNYFEYDTPQNFDELVKRYEERRSFNRMVITGAVSAYCIALFILSSMRNKVKEDLRNLCNNYD